MRVHHDLKQLIGSVRVSRASLRRVPSHPSSSRTMPAATIVAPFNPHAPSIEILYSHSQIPAGTSKECHVLRFKQFECDTAGTRQGKTDCIGFLREFLRSVFEQHNSTREIWRAYDSKLLRRGHRCAGKPSVEVTEFHEAMVKDWRARKAEAERQDD